jgi:hypothetical protein
MELHADVMTGFEWLLLLALGLVFGLFRILVTVDAGWDDDDDDESPWLCLWCPV